jgi:hypothetical protein
MVPVDVWVKEKIKDLEKKLNKSGGKYNKYWIN